MIKELGKKKFTSADNSFWVAENATVIGDIYLGKNSSVWFNAILRGDNEPIIVGDGSNIQDGAILHTDPGFKCEIGRNVTIGHMAMIHGCIIGDDTLIGINSVILNGAQIGKNCIIGAKALITEKMDIPDGSMVMGIPARITRQLSTEEQELPRLNSHFYVENAKRFRKEGF